MASHAKLQRSTNPKARLPSAGVCHWLTTCRQRRSASAQHARPQAANRRASPMHLLRRHGLPQRPQDNYAMHHGLHDLRRATAPPNASARLPPGRPSPAAGPPTLRRPTSRGGVGLGDMAERLSARGFPSSGLHHGRRVAMSAVSTSRAPGRRDAKAACESNMRKSSEHEAEFLQSLGVLLTGRNPLLQRTPRNARQAPTTWGMCVWDAQRSGQHTDLSRCCSSVKLC